MTTDVWPLMMMVDSLKMPAARFTIEALIFVTA
jgi:hypothetical protein